MQLSTDCETNSAKWARQVGCTQACHALPGSNEYSSCRQLVAAYRDVRIHCSAWRRAVRSQCYATRRAARVRGYVEYCSSTPTYTRFTDLHQQLVHNSRPMPVIIHAPMRNTRLAVRTPLVNITGKYAV